MNLKLLLMMTLIMTVMLGCTKDLETENRAPVLVRVLTDLSTTMNKPVVVTMAHIEAYDDDGDNLSVVTHEGSNYTSAGAVITPTTDFIGDLKVPVQVSDGKELSRMDTITVSVTKDLALMPLIPGAWWGYEDTVFAADTVITRSRLEVGDLSSIVIDGKNITAYDVQWSDLAEYNLSYLMNNDTAGTTLYGGISPTDTFVNEQRLYKYPAKLNESWAHTPLKYSASSGKFIKDVKTTQMLCTDTSIYITVPAGVFHCIELTYAETVNMGITRSASSLFDVYAGIRYGTYPAVRAGETVVTHKLYFSKGVGNVKTLSLQSGVTVWKRELTEYSVVEIKE